MLPFSFSFPLSFFPFFSPFLPPKKGVLSYQGRNTSEGQRGQILHLCRLLAQGVDAGFATQRQALAQPKDAACAERVSNLHGAGVRVARHPPPPARQVPFTSQLTRAFLTRVSTNQLPTVQSRFRSRGSCSHLSARALCKTQVGSYFHTTFVRSEVNRLHHSYLNLQKELVGSRQRVKNAVTYLGAPLYATSTATRLCWKG